jgi:hypothetical protein
MYDQIEFLVEEDAKIENKRMMHHAKYIKSKLKIKN